jgi:2-polyprenyl-3-methyl-5-hydroxy-6-metoxy-1,4-benzoquinol methylase
MPASYAEKLAVVMENTILPSWKELVSSYFETETVNRESVLDALYNNYERIRCVQGRPLLPSIIRDLSFIGWDKDMEPTPPFTDANDEWTNAEIIKYVWLKGKGSTSPLEYSDYWRDRRVCDIGCGTGTSTIITHKLGSTNAVYEGLEESLNDRRL